MSKAPQPGDIFLSSSKKWADIPVESQRGRLVNNGRRGAVPFTTVVNAAYKHLLTITDAYIKMGGHSRSPRRRSHDYPQRDPTCRGSLTRICSRPCPGTFV